VIPAPSLRILPPPLEIAEGPQVLDEKEKGNSEMNCLISSSVPKTGLIPLIHR
jgi:hypothetical protein